MTPRALVTCGFVFALPATFAWSFAGCGNSSESDGPSLDATTEGGPLSDVVVPEAAPVRDAGDAEAGPVVTPTSCSPVDSPACNVVLNDCPQNEAGVPGECLPGDGDASAFCTFERPSQHLPPGHICCPAATEAEETCLSGSECVGDPCLDGGPMTGRCGPRCCDDSSCGSSPEGIAGHCALDLVNENGDSLYQVCTYQRPCKLFHVQSCPTGETCTIQDQFGTSSCVDLFLPDGGAGAEGDTCAASNSCADGLTCLYPGDDDDDDDGGGDDSDDIFTCFYECVVSGFTIPIDASANAAPGFGGCPAGEVCNTLGSTESPPWLGFCAAP